MANYSLQYRIPFEDLLESSWRVDFLQKDGPIPAQPFILEKSANPLRLDKQNRNENQFTPIIKTVATISYVYRGGSDPHPSTFINIENDEYLIEVYKDDLLYWKGFLNADNNTYPFYPTPFEFSITATDFSFMNGALIDLNESDLFLYDYISIGEFFNRTLFYATGYEDISLNILYNKKPSVIGAGLMTDSLFIHTDAFFDFIKGRDFVTVCLERFLTSIGARLFYAGNSYWMQFLQDIGTTPQTVIQITPDNLSGIEISNPDTAIILINSPSSELKYLNRTQNVLIGQPLKQQTFNYNIKTINQLINFDWHDFNIDFPNDWTHNDLTYERFGAGSAEDPFRLRNANQVTGGGTFKSLQQEITASSGQRLSIQYKFVGNYAESIGIGIGIGQASTAQYALDPAGSWVPYNTGPVSNLEFGVQISNTNNGTFEIITDPIPADAVSDIHIYFTLIKAAASIPPGEVPYVDMYPVFVGLFNNEYIAYTERVVNPKKYSFVDDDVEMFFMDIQDNNVSNTIYYDVLGIKTPLPLNDWSGDSIDKIATTLYADQRARPPFCVLGDFMSNTLNFQQMVVIYDAEMRPALQIRDSYQVRTAKHTCMFAEIMEDNAANAIYTVTPIIRQKN